MIYVKRVGMVTAVPATYPRPPWCGRYVRFRAALEITGWIGRVFYKITVCVGDMGPDSRINNRLPQAGCALRYPVSLFSICITRPETARWRAVPGVASVSQGESA